MARYLKIYILPLFLLICTLSSFATEQKNLPYILLTGKMICLRSVPYCTYGSYGTTSVFDLKSHRILYVINHYISPFRTIISEDGTFIINYDREKIDIYREQNLNKTYYKSVLGISPSDVNNSFYFNGKLHFVFNDNFIIQSFISGHYFYALLTNSMLVKTDLYKEKKEEPLVSDTINPEKYKQLMQGSDKNYLFVDSDFEYLYAEDVKTTDHLSVETFIKKTVESITKDSFYLAITLEFSEKEVNIIQMAICSGPLFFCVNHTLLNEYDTETINLYYDVKRIFENRAVYQYKMPERNERWAISFSIPINMK